MLNCAKLCLAVELQISKTRKNIMLKNIIIISTFLLLLSTISIIKPIGAKSVEVEIFSSEELNIVENTNYQKASPRLNEILTIGALRQLREAQNIYRDTFGKGRFGTPAQLYEAGLIDAQLASLQKFGYNFSGVIYGFDFANPARFKLFATPKIYRNTGKKSFYFDNRCRLRGKDKNGLDATEEAPIIDVCSEVDELPQQDEMQVIVAMRQLANAQATYRSTVGKGNYGTLTQLYEAKLIDAYLASGLYSYYYFEGVIVSGSPNVPATFRFQSKPTIYGETGYRSFYIDPTGILRGADHEGGRADENDPPIKK